MVQNVFATSANSDNCSRHDLLAFVNDCLQANFSRIEEMSTGAAYCQLTDFLFRGKIPLRKVKWNSKSELDWISNWRLLQTSWKELGVEKAVPVERLIKGKFQDNFEFLQWFKKFFDANCTGNPYHPISARNGEPLPATVSTGPTRPVRMPVKKANPTNGVHTTATRAPAATTSRAVNRATNGTSSSHAVTSDLSAALNALQIEREHGRELQTQLEEASTAIESIEKERNFYFLKLQKIETYCQNAGENAEVPTKPIFDVLYEVEEGFAAPDDIETNGVDEEAEENPNVTITKTTQPHDDWQEEEAIPNARMNGDESLTF